MNLIKKLLTVIIGFVFFAGIIRANNTLQSNDIIAYDPVENTFIYKNQIKNIKDDFKRKIREK